MSATEEAEIAMRVGVFTPLLSQLPLPTVLKKLAALQIKTVELATGNYPGDAHCKLSMLDDAGALTEFKKILADQGVSISALSCHGNALHPDKSKFTPGAVHVHDLQATILHTLGFDHTRLTYRFMGRDFRLTDVAGEVLHDLIA